jgi:outer membrane murein-binding lipoprotein Lpp
LTVATAYPNLGFDPCPGSVESVSALRQRIGTASTSMQQANDLMNRLRQDNSSVWQGPAGDAFRQHLNSTLIEDLGKANQSLNQAVTTLQGWGTALSGYRQRAAGLEQEAARAKQRLDAAHSRQEQAAGNPERPGAAGPRGPRGAHRQLRAGRGRRRARGHPQAGA